MTWTGHTLYFAATLNNLAEIVWKIQRHGWNHGASPRRMVYSFINSDIVLISQSSCKNDYIVIITRRALAQWKPEWAANYKLHGHDIGQLHYIRILSFFCRRPCSSWSPRVRALHKKYLKKSYSLISCKCICIAIDVCQQRPTIHYKKYSIQKVQPSQRASLAINCSYNW